MNRKHRYGIRFVLLEWGRGHQYSLKVEMYDSQESRKVHDHVSDPATGEFSAPPTVKYSTIFHSDKFGGKHLVELLIAILNSPAAKKALNQAVNDFCHALLENKP